MKISFRAIAAVLACLLVTPSLAQNAGTVSLNALAVGNGTGAQGFKSLICTGFAVGTGAGAAPTCRVIASADIPASVALTGIPTAPTAAVDTNTTQMATTAFVLAQAGSALPVIDGAATVGTSTRFARQDHVHPTDTTRSPVASPTFTGVPAAPTAAVDTSTTQLATTAFVIGQASAVADGTPAMDGAAARGTGTHFARNDHVHPIDTSRAPLASPALTGVPTAPTAAPATNTTQLATTAYADAISALKVNLTRNVLAGCGLAGGGDLSADRTLRLSLTINAQVGVSYTVLDGDCGKLVTFNNAAAVAVTLPQANGSTFVSGWSVDFQNKGAGAVTITPTTSTINGATSLLLAQNQGVHCDSDGTNYSCVLGVGAGGGSGTVTNVATGTCLTGGPITATGTLSISDDCRQNLLLDRIYQAKLFTGYRRFINNFVDGFMAADGINTGSSTNYARTSTSPASSYVSPTPGVAPTVRIAAGTPTAPLGGTAANLNDNNTGTTTSTSALGTTLAAVAGRIAFKIDYGSNQSIGKVEIVGVSQDAGAAVANAGLYYSTDNVNWTLLGLANIGTTTTPTTYSNTSQITARYIGFAVAQDAWTTHFVTAQDLNGYAGIADNMTLITTAQTADASVGSGRVLLEYDNTAAPTLGTDLTAEVTCNGGTNWAAAALSSVSTNGQGGRKVVESVDQACTAGTSFAARIKTLNNKYVPVYGLSLTVH